MKTEALVKIGSMGPKDVYKIMEEVVVDMDYFMPTMFTIILQDSRSKVPGMFDLTDSVMKIKLGTPVEIGFGITKGTIGMYITNTLVKGEITSIEPIFAGANVKLRLRGYDKGHRLTHGKATRTYGDGNPNGMGIGDADIVKKIAREAGLSASVDSLKIASLKYKYIMQYNQNDWDFLWSRANKIGYQVYVEDKKLYFKPAGALRASKSPSDLEFGKNLTRFEPRVISTGQTTGAEAYGWNPKQKKEVKASSSSDTSAKKTSALAVTIPPSLTMRTSFQSSAKAVVVDPGIQTAGEAGIIAGAEYSRAASSFMRAYGELDEGDPFLVPGSMMKISKVGLRFTGNYYVTETKHSFIQGQYKTTFTVSGQIPTTFRSLILGADQMTKFNRVDGVMTGIVTSNNDPEKLGRIQVKYPWLPKMKSAELSSSWARLAIQGGGKDRGILFIPEVNDEVLLAFENGDMSYPYVVGVLYNGKDKPAQGDGELIDGGTKAVNQRVIVSRSGHKIILDDTKGKEKITIVDKTKKNMVMIDSAKNEFNIKSAGKLTINATGDMTFNTDGKLILKSKGNLSASSNGKVEMKAASSAEISGNQKVSLKAATSGLDLEAAGATLKGMKVDVKANTILSLDGTAMVKIQGGIVKIN